MKKTLKPNHLIKIGYLLLTVTVASFSIYLFFFLKNNVYDSVFFDQAKYPGIATKDNNLDEANFNKIISNIETKKNSPKKEIADIFN